MFAKSKRKIKNLIWVPYSYAAEFLHMVFAFVARKCAVHKTRVIQRVKLGGVIDTAESEFPESVTLWSQKRFL